jgi:two-component system nitrogen regulation response regulator GlnG
MIGEHPSMRDVYSLARRAAPTDLTVVIEGETGTGKELVARAVHELSAHRDGPFVDLNCAAIPENLVESELFGWERGAFTGANRSVRGLLEEANGGTLFLDEACSLPKAAQTKLLRAIERREHRRVGGRATVQSCFRLVLALQRPLLELIRTEAYLPAFAHRIDGVAVYLPTLASRGKDIRRLAEAFLVQVSSDNRRALSWSVEALEQLERQPWPGNVRELRALVARIPLDAQGGDHLTPGRHGRACWTTSD